MCEHSWDAMGFGCYPVTVISHYPLKLHDGVEVAIKVWLPCSIKEIADRFHVFVNEASLKWTEQLYNGDIANVKEESETFPTIMEYIPYSKDSAFTLQRDHSRHSWFCSHGYVEMRVDLRGTGASGGYYFGEYDEQEIQDCVEIIEWIASQPWSNERVGMYGKSWGGFNGLQVAYEQPKALQAVISLYSSDSRFTDDAHYQGDTMIGEQMLSWSGVMFYLNSRPMHPRYFDDLDTWKEFWLKRLETAGQSFLTTWLHHQHKEDPFWKHSSISEDPKRLKCPVLVFGGNADCYTNAAYRMAATLNESSRAIMGPWGHQWPDNSVVGPNIDFLNTCLQWWNYHLKDDTNHNVLAWPRFSLYIRDAMRPDEIIGSPNGKWVSLPNWKEMYQEFKSANYQLDVQSSHYLKCLYLGESMSIQFDKGNTEVPPVSLVPHVLQGAGYGSWYCPAAYGFAEDQNVANQHSQCWLTNPLEDDIVITGFGKLFVCVEVDRSGNYALQVRLCDKFPDGGCTLVTRGCQSLSGFDKGKRTKFPAGKKKIICVELKGIGQTIESGHQLLISISPTCFPQIYPTIDCEGLKVYPSESFLTFQTATNEMLQNTTTYPRPIPLLELPVVRKTENSFSSSITNNGADYEFETVEKTGLVSYPTMSYENEETCVEKYTTDERVSYGEISANRTGMSLFGTKNGDKIKTHVETFQKMTGDSKHFRVYEHLKVTIDGEVCFDKKWDNIVPRKYV